VEHAQSGHFELIDPAAAVWSEILAVIGGVARS
jgi:hypothetical protein